MIDWLIIGGGIHGTALSLYLTKRKKYDRVHVLDPHEEPLALWKRFTANTGMIYLRSPMAHHLHYDPWSLRTFSETKRGKPHAKFIPIFQRPALELFNRYSDWLIQHHKLDTLRLIGRATHIKRLADCWQVETTNGVLQAKNIVLAIGTSEQPHIPIAGTHIFSTDFVWDDFASKSHVTVIGGGISAAQLAINLPTQVTMISRHTLRESHFDSDPCWVTRLCLRDFYKETDFNKRRQIITQARKPGSLPSNVRQALESAIQQGKVDFQVSENPQIDAENTILATGFEKKRPGGEMLDTLIQEYDLPVANCGYPIVDKRLQWYEGLFVMGPLAELEIGPVSRNIIGARLASERIR